MRRRTPRQRSAAIVAALLVAVTGLILTSVGSADANPKDEPPGQTTEHVCAQAPAKYARCHAIRVKNPSKRPPRSTTTTTTAPTTTEPTTTTTSTTSTTTTSTTTTTTTSTTTTTQPTTTTAPASTCTDIHDGYTPCDLQDAYGLGDGGDNMTVAIVDAFDNPNVEADLGVYRSTYGLPPCTTANGCFRKVDQSGGTSYPAGDVGWGEEISLDVDMVSAVCPKCHILLVEANSNGLLDLFAAVDTAARLGANAISNSYGANEFSSETFYESHYNHPGVAITASSGDSGYGVSFPASSQYVTAVGGTSLTRSANARGWTETAWSGAGSGCSRYEPKPAWQSDAGCSKRTVADVSAVADPNTGVAVYDTYGNGGWLVFGGTSVSAPIVAAIYALAGNTSQINDGSYPYSHTTSLWDVTSGSNGNCGGSYLCTGKVGYDGPTGLGTPRGQSAF